MLFKTSLAVMTLGAQFFLGGWIWNWAPLHVMLTDEEYYANDCHTRLSSTSTAFTTCIKQQVEISTLWSAVLLSECTVLPIGILLDCIGPSLFSLFILLIHVFSFIAIIEMSKETPMLYIPFFLLGTAAQACWMLACRTVYIFNTAPGRQRWSVAASSLSETSCIWTIVFYMLWDDGYISIDDMYWILAIAGAVIYGAIALCWLGMGHKEVNTSSDSNIVINEESTVFVPMLDIITDSKFYFFVFISAVNIYRLRYFLGLVGFTLRELNDDGTYLQLFGWSFAWCVVFGPVVKKILSKLDSQFSQLQFINGSILAVFVIWMIPNLQIQLVTFALFILARLVTFSVLHVYCATEFSVERLGLVNGIVYIVAGIPEAFTYKIVDVVLSKYNGKFWIFHLMCIAISIPVALITWYFQRNSEREAEDFKELPSESENDVSTIHLSTR